MTLWVARLAPWILFVALETTAQLTLKHASGAVNPEAELFSQLSALSTNAWLQASLCCDVLNVLVWVHILKRHDLSVAVPASSVCYVAVILGSVLLFNERPASLQMFGLAAIALGIALVSTE